VQQVLESQEDEDLSLAELDTVDFFNSYSETLYMYRLRNGLDLLEGYFVKVDTPFAMGVKTEVSTGKSLKL